MRPTKYLKWSARDRSLAEALLTHQDSLNPLGIPTWIAQDATREFVVDETVDGAMAALDEAREEYSRGEGKNYGLQLLVVEKAVPGSVLPGLAEVLPDAVGDRQHPGDA